MRRGASMVEDAAEGYSRCKSFGHRWPRDPSPNPPDHRPPPRGWIFIYMVCEECTMEKRILVHKSSGTTENRYKKPKGYSLSGLSRADWKASWAQQWDNGNGKHR